MKRSLVSIFMIALVIIYESNAGVVLKKFKPKRSLSADVKKKVNSTETQVKMIESARESIVTNFTEIVETMDSLLNDTNSTISNFVDRNNCSNSKLFDQNCSHISSGISKNSSHSLELAVSDIKSENQSKANNAGDDSIVNKPENESFSAVNEDVNHESFHLNLSHSMLSNPIEREKLITLNDFPLNENISIDSLELDDADVSLKIKPIDTLVVSNRSNKTALNNSEVQLVSELAQSDLQENPPIHKSAESTEILLTLQNQTEIGLESLVSAGLDFLANSEVAKNALDIISDTSLTDHIIDDSDSVIEFILPSLSTRSDQNSTLPENAQLSNIEDRLKNEKNATLILIPEITESSGENGVNNSNEIIPTTDPIVSLKDKKKCPPSRICIFWFIARNTCADDNECLGSKICCKVRCSKQCIDG